MAHSSKLIMKYQRIHMLVRFLTCFLILAAVAVQRDGSLFGHDFSTVESDETGTVAPVRSSNGATIVNTTTLASDVKGYGGPTPLEITIENGKISKIETLDNSESEDFFKRVRTELIPEWIGISVSDVQSVKIDAVTGATLSSNAVNTNIREGVAYAVGNPAAAGSSQSDGSASSLRYWIVLLVVLCAAVVPMFVKNKYYRYLQLVANVIVLGFWSGTFLSYELFINYIANGANVLASLAAILMLIVAFIYPYFGKKTHYCAWVCPLGSLQELCGKSVRYKLKMSPKAVLLLSQFQEYLWYVLIFLMVAGIWFDWIEYELFKAFILKSASVGVLIAAAVVVLLSFIVQRPYCRFICPTGCLLHITQDSK